MLFLNQFLLSKSFLKVVLGFPVKLLVEIGRPFKYLDDSSIPSHWTKTELESAYKKAQLRHYRDKWGMTAIALGAIFLLILLILITRGYILLLPIPALMFTLLIDCVLMVARVTYMVSVQKKQADTGQALVPLDHFSDTSLVSLTKKHEANIAEKKALVAAWVAENPGVNSRSYDAPSHIRHATECVHLAGRN